MGSLVAGWDSPTSSSGEDRLERNKSTTNEEIETFWKTMRKAEEEQEHLKTVAEAQGHATSDIQNLTNNNIEESEAVLIRGDTHRKLVANRPVSEALLIRGDTHRKLVANRPVGLDSIMSFPGCNTTTVAAGSQFTNDDDLDNLRNAKAWWTRSNSAFLNEPPLMATEGSTQKYATQFHVSAPGCKESH